MESASIHMHFSEGLVEADNGRAAADRTDPASTEHRGRTGIVVPRKIAETAYFRVKSKRTQKGAPTPPEEFEEIDDHLSHLLGEHVLLCADGAGSWKKFGKQRGPTPVLDANHAKKEFVRLHNIPAPRGSPAHKTWRC